MSRASIYAEVQLVHQPQPGERVYFRTYRGSAGYATVRAVRFNAIAGRDYFLLDPEPNAVRGADYFPRTGRWWPRDIGMSLRALEHPQNTTFSKF